MISILVPPTNPTKVVARTVAIPKPVAANDDLTHPGPDSSATSPSPSVELPEPAPKKRKREPSELDAKAPAKVPRKKRTTGAPRGKRVQHLREESAPLPDNAVRNRSRTRERCTGSNRMGALESTIPLERWWREAQPAQQPTEAPEAESSQPTAADPPARKHIQSVDVVRPKWKGYRACKHHITLCFTC